MKGSNLGVYFSLFLTNGDIVNGNYQHSGIPVHCRGRLWIRVRYPLDPGSLRMAFCDWTDESAPVCLMARVRRHLKSQYLVILVVAEISVTSIQLKLDRRVDHIPHCT